MLPSVTLVTRSLPGSSDFPVTAAMIAGTRHRVVVDTLIQPADMAPFAGATLVVYTHSDWDHCWGTAAFPGVPVIGHRVARERLTAPEAAEFLAQMRAKNPAAFAESQIIPPGLTFPHRLTIDAGGLTIDLHHLPGHTADSVVVHVPELGLLLAGDAVERPIPTLSEPGHIRQWAEELRRWSRAGVTHVVPGHGRPGGPELLAANAAYIDRLVEAAESGLAKGQSADEIAAELPLGALLPPGVVEQLPDYYREQHRLNIAQVVAELQAGR
ncbi:glyoxylase-like metal-dependent hydrolase (beta-lactamase superfamily II) [Symbiobacterium terraclitae]|uniref:Glyoxylase-like metal-dependent hydrolase (Beta-lactamase superfamily II) n=1 Tax=Symbiobacterium terraclitae TaxID=557451 RepID=A0ABS4JRR1_9FIRM|nr:MBL fold metallo-hydrolase [Symbiobacterium terraclitae]MBP2018215.1 glyoxylase-like metal-dependent hydrolase (beta-lactamase superfamily II) [Symbiobacterium terraclitae]